VLDRRRIRVKGRVIFHIHVVLAHSWVLPGRRHPQTADMAAALVSMLRNDSFRYIVAISVAHPALPFQKRDQPLEQPIF
jgi:hypothetical protein